MMPHEDVGLAIQCIAKSNIPEKETRNTMGLFGELTALREFHARIMEIGIKAEEKYGLKDSSRD